MVRFGPSGNSDSFYEQGYKSSLQMPSWLSGLGLDAYEYQCSKGVKIGESLAVQLGEQARANNIHLSIHAPYYINMASEDADKRANSRRYIMETLKAAMWMGAGRIVVHTGSCSGMSREKACTLAAAELKAAISEADEAGYGDIAICPEVLGKLNQLGSLEEILNMCTIDERLIPTIDFGHLHARSMGGLKTVGDFVKVLDAIENVLGNDRLKNFHMHFSRIEYTQSGEKKHWNFEDSQFGPEFEMLAEAFCRKNAGGIVICESRGKMAEDAASMKRIYDTVCKK